MAGQSIFMVGVPVPSPTGTRQTWTPKTIWMSHQGRTKTTDCKLPLLGADDLFRRSSSTRATACTTRATEVPDLVEGASAELPNPPSQACTCPAEPLLGQASRRTVRRAMHYQSECGRTQRTKW